MEVIITLIAIAIGVNYVYRFGKRDGSRKAFGVGFRRARKRFRRKADSRKR